MISNSACREATGKIVIGKHIFYFYNDVNKKKKKLKQEKRGWTSWFQTVHAGKQQEKLWSESTWCT